MKVKNLKNLTEGYKVNLCNELKQCAKLMCVAQVGCVINVENWTKWLLAEPVHYFKYGSFLPSQ